MTESNRVVIVDDNEDITSVMSDILDIGGFNIVGIGHDGKEAVSLYRKHKPDFIFLDVRMPIMNGIQALKEIKDENSNANVIMITADDGTGIIQELKKLNATAIIVKPFKIETIFETIKNINK
ncbi:MAG: response regulator [Nitrosarchaeum sp.]|nr:response regulator [Nitrosarchaeum sp.]MBI4130993.1 response regulator [Nitrosarchaeum sp.]